MSLNFLLSDREKTYTSDEQEIGRFLLFTFKIKVVPFRKAGAGNDWDIIDDGRKWMKHSAIEHLDRNVHNEKKTDNDMK